MPRAPAHARPAANGSTDGRAATPPSPRHAGHWTELIHGRPYNWDGTTNANAHAKFHRSMAAAAEEHVRSAQRGEGCSERHQLLLARTDRLGVGNDIFQFVKALVVALSQRRQLVVLPPPVEWQRQHAADFPHGHGVSGAQPWHHFAGADFPFYSLIVPSACEERLGRAGILEELSRTEGRDPQQVSLDVLRNSSDPLVAALGRRSRVYTPNWRVGLSGSLYIPHAYRHMGMLWWFQIATSYLVRAREPLATVLRTYPPYAKLMASPGMPLEHSGHGVGRRIHAGHVPQDARAVPAGMPAGWEAEVGPGWYPPVWFDVSLHIRMGDACAKDRRGNYLVLKRGCSETPLQDALALMRSHGLRGSLFVASDSQAVVDLATKGTALISQFGFGPVYALEINRSRYENTSLGTQINAARWDLSTRRQNVIESLLDLLLASRSHVLVGSMMSNFPRVALQMRVQEPGTGKLTYLPLDGRLWCSRSSCRMNYTAHYFTVR